MELKLAGGTPVERQGMEQTRKEQQTGTFGVVVVAAATAATRRINIVAIVAAAVVVVAVATAACCCKIRCKNKSF